MVFEDVKSKVQICTVDLQNLVVGGPPLLLSFAVSSVCKDSVTFVASLCRFSYMLNFVGWCAALMKV